MSEHVVCRADELGPGQRRLVTIAGRAIGVFNVAGQLYALRDRCPHHGAPLCRGRIGGTTSGRSAAELRHERDGEILRCAWHGWEFDITTGHALADPRVRARTYPVSVRDGDVVVMFERTRGAPR